MRILDRLRHRSAAFTHDLVMVPIAWLGAYLLRFNLDAIPEPYLSVALAMLPVVVLTQAAVFWYFGLYRGVWRFASVPDLIRILKAVIGGIALSAVFIFFLTRMHAVPRSVFPLYGLLLTVLLGGPRLVYRWFKDHHLYGPLNRRVLIVGAGRAGELLVRDLLRNRDVGYTPIGFVDDDPAKRGRDIHGVRVLGACDSLPQLVARDEADLVMIALPSATSKQMRRIVSLCEKTSVPLRTLPRIGDLVSGQATLRELREVSIEDLLGREPVSLDWPSITRGIAGKVVLVSGGGGSIGSELCRQVARLCPSALIVLDRSEFNLYAIEMELVRGFPSLLVRALLADVCDATRVERIVEEYRPEVIFHAAAYKHVPMLESQPREAVRNNVLGTRVLAEAAGRHHCGSFVLISTDKAVNPANVMGASKRVAEILSQHMGEKYPGTRFITVRFGNVLDSAGSVVPLFRSQIAAGGPITVTHPDVKRYFMTIPESCQLILQAAAIGEGGEIYVLDMGEPIKITYLAEQMIRLAGKTPGEDIEIVYTGLRPGEKLFEELFHDGERLISTSKQKILLARTRAQERAVVGEVIERLLAACERYDDEAVRALLQRLVPESRAAVPTPVPDNVTPIQRGKAPPHQRA